MASLADMRVVRTVETRATTAGVRESADQLRGLAAAHDQVGKAAAGSAMVTETSARGQSTLAGAYERVRRQLDPLVAATEKYDRTMRALDQARGVGQSTFEEHARLAELAARRLEAARERIERAESPGAPKPSPWGPVPMVPGGSVPLVPRPAREEIEKTTVANDNLTKSIGLQRHEWVNLGRQMQDVGTMALMGASPFQIIASQGAQVYDVLATSGGGVKGALKEVGTTLLGLVTPGRLAFAGIVGGAALATAALSRASEQANEVNRALRTGAGLRSGMAAGDVEALSRAPDLSRSEGRAAALAYGGAGASRANTAAALGLTRSLADVMYEGDTAAAQKGLSDAMRGGTASLLKYVDAIRPLSPATTDWIERIEATKGEQAANVELLRILNDGVKAAGIEIPLWRQALRGVGNAASDLADSFLREAARRADTTAEEARRVARALTPGGPSSADARAGRPLAVVGGDREPAAQRQSRVNIDLPPDGLDIIAGSLADLQAERERGIAGAKQARGLNQIYDADAEALRRLNNDLAAYDRLLKDSAVTSQMTTAEIEAARKAREVADGAVKSRLDSEEKRQKSTELAIRSINARTDAERAAIAVEQKRLDLAGQKVDIDRKQAEIDAQRIAMARSTKEAEDRLRASNDNLGLAGLLPYERSHAEIEQRFRRQNELSAGNDDALRRNALVRANELRALDIEQIQGPLRATTMSINEQVAALRVQRDSMFATDQAAAEMAARQELVNAAIRSGIDPAKAYGGQLDELAKQLGRVKVAGEEAARARQGIVGGLDEFRSGFSGTFSGAASDLIRGKDPRQTLLNSALRMNDQFLERAVFKPLTEGLLGRFGQPGGGLLGDLIGKSGIFGTMPQTITAPTVVIQAASVTVTSLAGALGANPLTGSALTGAGSGREGFGLGGAQGTGTAAPLGSGLSAFGLGALGASSTSALRGANLGANAEAVYKGLVARGFTPVQAAAAVGNIKVESGFNTGIEGDKGLPGGSSFGLMQWREERLANLKALAASQGKSWQDRDVQLDFIAQEARGGDPGFSRWFRSTAGATDVRDATASFARDVERPRADALARSLGARTGAASSAYDRWGSDSRADVGSSTIDYSAALKSVQTSTDEAAKAASDLSQSVGQIPGAASSATSGLSSFISSLFSFKPGSGGIDLGNLFSWGGSAVTASANGNVMTKWGPAALNRYEVGGIATSPQVSIFGEGRLPEAYVPLPDGRSIPVTMKDARPQTAPAASANGGALHYAPTYNIPPVANGVTPHDVISAIEAYDRRLDRKIVGRLAEHQRRYG